MRDAAGVTIVLFALILGRCKVKPDAKTDVWAKDYDQGCATVADCVPVLEQDERLHRPDGTRSMVSAKHLGQNGPCGER